MNKWMLPAGVEEALPPVSWQIEDLRRKLLDDYRKRGYELILPPLIEHLDALLTGSAAELEAQTFKLTDPDSGRLLGLRADMTPQAARIAARHYGERDVIRLCYLGTVLRARPNSPGGPRSPLQVGCEIFGEPTLAADLEAIQLMLRTLSLAKLCGVHLDLGHVGIYRAVVKSMKLDVDAEAQLFDLVQRKSQPDLAEFVRQRGIRARAASTLGALMDLHGGAEVIDKGRALLNGTGPEVEAALDALAETVAALRRQSAKLPIHLDLTELRGYRYQTGMVFAAFVADHGREIARGGRYDGIGREFGAALPATGFSADLNELLRLGA